MRKQPGRVSLYRSGRRRFSSRSLFGIMVPAILVMIAGVSFVTPKIFSSHAADGEHQPQQQQQQQQQQQMINCTLTVPANPLTAQGLATPYKLGGGCDEANKMQAAFVQGAVIDPAGNISVYNPLVVNQDQQSDQQQAAAPVMPNIPAGSTVGIWFGFNGNNLTLRGMKGSLKQGNCVNGTNDSIFGQFAYCNAPAFFQAANAAMAAGKINPNPANAALGTGKDGLPCPTVRDFGVVDQDQSDNVTTTYVINGTQQVNASDNRLLDVALDGALGCTPLMAPDLAHPGQMTTALPLNELQAAAQQAAPVALVPRGDPMTLVDANPNTRKTNLYRMGVDQPAVGASDGGNTTTYCRNLRKIAPQRMVTDALLTGAANSLDPAAANSLFTFMAQRFQTTFEGPLGTGLQCTDPNQGPVQVQQDANGVAISATITLNDQAQCFDNMGNKVAMTVCKNNANAMNNTNNNNDNGNGNGNGMNNANNNNDNNNNGNGTKNANNNDNGNGNGTKNANDNNNNGNGMNNANNNNDDNGNGMNNANNNNDNNGNGNDVNNANNNNANDDNGNGKGNGNDVNNANNNNNDNNGNGTKNANNNDKGNGNGNGNGNGMNNANDNNGNGNGNGMNNANDNNTNDNGKNNTSDNNSKGTKNTNDNNGNGKKQHSQG